MAETGFYMAGVFHGSKAVATLKLPQSGHPRFAVEVFHGSKDVATLKLDHHPAQGRAQGGFPRQQGRGHIEAESYESYECCCATFSTAARPWPH